MHWNSFRRKLEKGHSFFTEVFWLHQKQNSPCIKYVEGFALKNLHGCGKGCVVKIEGPSRQAQLRPVSPLHALPLPWMSKVSLPLTVNSCLLGIFCPWEAIYKWLPVYNTPGLSKSVVSQNGQVSAVKGRGGNQLGRSWRWRTTKCCIKLGQPCLHSPLNRVCPNWQAPIGLCNISSSH